MKTSPRAFIEVLANSPALRPVLHEADGYWAPQEPPETTLLSSFANRLLEASKNPATAETQRAMLLVETAMQSGDMALTTVVATGFIEGLVASASERGLLLQFLAALGPSSRRHADAWLAFGSEAGQQIRHCADEAVHAHLRHLEQAMDKFGSALPENADRPPHRLVITRIDEHDFGWVYFYDSAEYVETGDFLCALAGNAPVIVDRATCRLYSSGTAHPVEHYVEEFRKGVRHPIQDAAP